MYISENEYNTYRIGYTIGIIVGVIIDIILICLLVTAFVRSKENRIILKYIAYKEKDYRIDINKLKNIEEYIYNNYNTVETMKFCKKYLDKYLETTGNTDYKIVIRKESQGDNISISEVNYFEIIYKDNAKVMRIDTDTLSFLRYDIENKNDIESFLAIFK